MYLWKCWRDTRVKFLVVLGLFVCQGALFGQSGPPGNATQLPGMFFRLLVLGEFIVLFGSWILGADNVGADIGRGSGDFLLTRPSSRGSFVWTGWMVGMVESVLLWIVYSTLSVERMIFQMRHYGVGAATISSSWLVFMKLNLPVVFLMFVIDVGLVYGLTYCIGVVMRSGSRALIGTAALFLSYEIVKQIAMQEFHLVLPEILLYPDHFGWPVIPVIPPIHAFVIRGALALTFPVLAYFALERMEVNS
jgi:hypothetical protein